MRVLAQSLWVFLPERYQLAVEAEQLIGHTHFKQLSLFELAQLFKKNKTYNSKITISQYLKIKHNNEILFRLVWGRNITLIRIPRKSRFAGLLLLRNKGGNIMKIIEPYVEVYPFDGKQIVKNLRKIRQDSI